MSASDAPLPVALTAASARARFAAQLRALEATARDFAVLAELDPRDDAESRYVLTNATLLTNVLMRARLEAETLTRSLVVYEATAYRAPLPPPRDDAPEHDDFASDLAYDAARERARGDR